MRLRLIGNETFERCFEKEYLLQSFDHVVRQRSLRAFPEITFSHWTRSLRLWDIQPLQVFRYVHCIYVIKPIVIASEEFKAFKKRSGTYSIEWINDEEENNNTQKQESR